MSSSGKKEHRKGRGSIPSYHRNGSFKKDPDYKSVQSKMTLMKSSFTPQKGWKVAEEMISSHMSCHKRRIDNAETRVDTSLPTSMTHSTLWRNRNKPKSNSKLTTSPLSAKKSQGTTPNKCVHFNLDISANGQIDRSRTGRSERVEHGITSCELRVNPTSNDTPEHTMQSSVSTTASPYITKTAQLTVSYQNRNSKKHRDESKGKPVSPWKPVVAKSAKYQDFIGFSESSLPLPVVKLHKESIGLMEHENCRLVDPLASENPETLGLTQVQSAASHQEGDLQMQTSEDSKVYANSIIRHESNNSSCGGGRYSSDEFEDESEDQCSDVSQSLYEEECERPTPFKLQVAGETSCDEEPKDQPMTRDSLLGTCSTESQYLSFVSSITKDVIARGVYSDAGLELLFAEHIEKNKGRLNLREMKIRVQKLRQELNIPTS